ncbi:MULTISPECIES: DUF397 domain-containing protein [Actinoalloteichus]|uniref:DUF397 family protein n=1 Tax=Actinoalloteichus fjordicus TaxID=1612552 RepID=A0AAC9PV84_9PSEU|nr:MULTISPECIES: DUF397 domain-containing protein [Actinoalloteichus]APU17872.1 putative DUF397 family protein [Actinoalloteichus fjordicus]APU23950.1 putative DUF397 family protein [Actinoalloteichus sp. GBA129-24]
MNHHLRHWRTSTYTETSSTCVEIGEAPGLVGIRDTKNRDGGTLIVDRRVFAAFVASVKDAHR